jgi:hypothetical protein
MKLGVHPVSWVGIFLFAVALPLWVFDIFLGREISVGTLFGPDFPRASTPLWLVVVVLAALVYLVGRVLEVVGKFKEHRAGR